MAAGCQVAALGWVHPNVGGKEVTFQSGEEGDLEANDGRFVKRSLQCSVEEQYEHGLGSQ